MYIHEYGDKGLPNIVLLAPMLVSGADIYRLINPYLKGKYHIIAPDQGGHGKAGSYVNADKEYKELRTYLLSNGYEDILFVYGASLGVSLGYRLFLDPNFKIKCAWFDGVSFCKRAPLAEWFMRRIFKRKKRELNRTKTDALPIFVKIYGQDLAKMMTANFKKLSKEEIDKMCHACCHYDLRGLTDEEQKKLHLDFGSKDFDLFYSKKTMPKYMPKVTPKIRKGFTHCQYMAFHTEEYVKEIEDFIESNEKFR